MLHSELKVGAIIQARMSSTRLPGKVLMPLAGRPMLTQQLVRIKRCRNLEHIFVGTSTGDEDDIIAKECKANGTLVRRGSLEDVLDRFYNIAKTEKLDVIIRLTADCPLADPHLLEVMIQKFFASGADYLSNCAPPTFPDGLDAEIMTFNALETAWKLARLPSEREHVTPFIRNVRNGFRVENFEHHTDLSSFRWTVDEEADLEFVRAVYNGLIYSKPEFNWHDILDLLQQKPQLTNINAGIGRNEGSLKSMLADKAFLKKSQNEI